MTDAQDTADELAKEMGLVLVLDPSAIARRAVRCDAWRWMVRMGDALGRTVLDVDPVLGDPSFGDGFIIGALPDLDDPATLGCLLALVRDAWGDPHVNTSPDGVTWAVFSSKVDSKVSDEYTEAEALVAALEAAPQVTT